jgi:hypothetical protein
VDQSFDPCCGKVFLKLITPPASDYEQVPNWSRPLGDFWQHDFLADQCRQIPLSQHSAVLVPLVKIFQLGRKDRRLEFVQAAVIAGLFIDIL